MGVPSAAAAGPPVIVFQHHRLPQHGFGMGASGVSRLLCLLFCWNFAGNLGDAQKLPGVKKASLKVQINATSDTVILKFLRPSPNMNLEGFILGYGSSFFSTQYIPMPENGKSYDAELDAEPRYLVAVRPSPIVNTKKSCSGQPKVQKPLQVVVGTLSPSSVYLAWGVLVNPQYDWTVLNKCPTDRFYTVRYREKEKNKKWLFQLCPNTETVVDNLKPNVIYEFGVKDNSEDGIWNKGVTHKTTVPPKHKINGGNGHIQNTYNGPKGNIQMAPEDAKMLVPITVIKQVVQNISIPKKPKSTVAPSSTVTKAAERKSQRSTTTLTSTGDLETARAPTAFYEEKFISASSLEPDSAEAASTESAPSSGDQETTGPILSSALQLLGTTLAVNDTRPLPEILGTPEEPEIHKTATTETEIHEMTQEPPTVIPDTSPKLPDSTSVSIEPTVFPSREDTSAAPEIRGSKPVSSKQRIPDPILPRASQIQEQPKATVGVYETPFISQEPRSSEGPERPQTNPGPKEPMIVPPKLSSSAGTDRPQSKPAPTESQTFSSSKPKTAEDARLEAVPNEIYKFPSAKPKATQTTNRPLATPAPKKTQRVPINLIRLQIFGDPNMTSVPNEIHKFPSAKPKATQTTERPLATSVPNRTTQVTAQPRSNNLNWISETAIGGKLNGQDNTKLLGVSRNTSMEPNGTVRRPVSGSTPRVPLAPARPTHMRRRLLHPSNVTGRPGMPGNGLIPRAPSSSMRFMPKPTQVVTVERTQRLKEKTTSAPEQETVTEPIFNANPVSEIDPVGKPRYTAPHVKYMRKEDLVPCSITESLKHFPKELATNEEEATAAPQNPPSNLTVVAVEGCPSFVILDWEQPNNDTVTEYKVISKENGAPSGKDQSISTTNQTHSTVENLKPDTSYEFKVIASNIIGEGPPSTTVTHNTESADPRVSEPLPGGKDAIWTEIKFKSDTYSECKGKQYVKRTWYKKFVGIQLCNSLRYKIYLSDKLSGKFYNIGDESGYGEDHCQFVDSFLDGRTGQQLLPEQLPSREGFYRSVRQQPVEFGKMGSQTHVRYVHWYECGTTIPGKW